MANYSSKLNPSRFGRCAQTRCESWRPARKCSVADEEEVARAREGNPMTHYERGIHKTSVLRHKWQCRGNLNVNGRAIGPYHRNPTVMVYLANGGGGTQVFTNLEQSFGHILLLTNKPIHSNGAHSLMRIRSFQNHPIR